ncbi:MAG: xdhC [Modestobacter sp.]|nr:xdhC [Modestobacter sp.]
MSSLGRALGARTPDETVVPIAAEIIAGRWGGTGERLTGVERPIHRTAER